MRAQLLAACEVLELSVRNLARAELAPSPLTRRVNLLHADIALVLAKAHLAFAGDGIGRLR